MKIYKIAQTNVIGPVYHGTVYKFDPKQLKGEIIFFTDNKSFAYDYASQKSFERQMDADITIIESYIKGNVFDPKNEEHVDKITPYLSEKITVYNDFGMDAKLPIDIWKKMITGVYVIQPYWSSQDLEGKKPGDYLPENDVYGKHLKYQIIDLTPDQVFYIDRGFVDDVLRGRYTFYHGEERKKNMERTIEEVISDLRELDKLEFIKKYGLFNDLHYFPVILSKTRYPVTTYNNDVWRWLEGNGVFDAIKKAGFNIVKSRERNNVTYAVFESAEIIIKGKS
jgi:hypothetical protein